jgi:hypothetical protein
MNENKRLPEAANLRSFFDEQIHHLHTRLNSLHHQDHAKQQQIADEQLALENFVDLINNKIRSVNGYPSKLRLHVQTLYNHVLKVSDSIPAPLSLTDNSFSTNPLVNALFVNSNEIDKLVETNPEIIDFLDKHNKAQVPVLYALLTAGCDIKHILGIGLQGDMLIRELPQDAVNFYAHKIHAPCADSTELNTALKTYLFDLIANIIKREMSARLANEANLTSDNFYQSKVNSLANPEIYLHSLIAYLEDPVKLLSIAKPHFKLTKLGIKIADDDQQWVNEFDLPELTWHGGMQQVVLQIAYERKRL